MTDAAPSPIAEVDPDSVTALFDRDPLTLDDASLDRLIDELRSRADSHKAAKAREDAAPKAERTRAVKTASPAAQALRDKPIAEVALDDLFDDE
jgi:hypothetical protein